MSNDQSPRFKTANEELLAAGLASRHNAGSSKLRFLKKLFFVSGDLLLTYLSFVLAHLLCCGLNSSMLPDQDLTLPFTANSMSLPLMWFFATCLAGLIFILFGFYRQLWRYASIPEYLALVFGTLVFTGSQYVLSRFMKSHRPLSYFIILWMVLLILIIGYRLIYRLLLNRHSLRFVLSNYSHTMSLQRKKDPACAKVRVMIIGAGYAGNQIIRDMQENDSTRSPIIIIDDDLDKHGLTLNSVPIVGDRNQIAQIAQNYRIDEIVLAVPGASVENRRELLRLCKKTNCKVRILPRMSEIISGKVSVSDIKNVEIEDLLGRDEVKLNMAEIAEYLTDQVVMVTGGGGSIGSEICRQVVNFAPRQLIVFDIYENNAYDLQQELNSLYEGQLELVIVIGSVRDKERLNLTIEEYQPTIIFHAAAHKHVPLMEDNRSEAVKNNVLGTYYTALAAGQNKVRRFVLISTDKAVNPTNVMGASKRLAELVLQLLNRQYSTTYVSVRFGNVLGSNGSVVPLFNRQIREQRRITVTDPEVTRYFMTIPEAARLVIQAGALASDSDIFVLDMGEPVKIIDLAHDLIRLSDLEPGKDVEVTITGLRPGEKMYEELCLDMETMDRTSHEKIFVMKPVKDPGQIYAEIMRMMAIIGWSNKTLDDLLASFLSLLEAAE